jgi:hypothetical protein
MVNFLVGVNIGWIITFRRATELALNPGSFHVAASLFMQ